MGYNHEDYLHMFARSQHIDFHVAASWKEMLAHIPVLTAGALPCVVADYDESSRFETVNDDAILEYRTYSAYFLARAEVGNPNSVPAAKRDARAMADRFARRLLHDAALGGLGLTHLERESLGISSLGMVGDWAFGVLVTYTLVGGYVYAE